MTTLTRIGRSMVGAIPGRPSRARMLNRYTRRAVTIPLYALIGLLAVVTAPACYLVTFLADRITGRLALTRTLAWIHIYLFAELAGVAVCTWLWLLKSTMTHDEWLEGHYKLERWWARSQFESARLLYGIHVEVAGGEVLREGPYILLSRHVSIVDNMIPSVFAGSGNGIRLRWVFARRLLRQPSIDMVGNRLPNVFVDPKGGRPVRDLSRIAALARNLGPRDAVVIYPEGTLFSLKKRQNIREKLRQRMKPELLRAAEEFENVLPPEFGGVLMLLRSAPGVDVVFCAHSGLEDALNRSRIAQGGLIGRTLRVRFWRVPAAEIPASSGDRRAWLLEQWKGIDSHAAAAGAAALPE